MTRTVRARILHLVVLVAGLAAFGWALLAPVPAIRCHDQVMRPGDVCSYASLDGSNKGKTQSYEERLATEKSARPVVATVGLLVAGFGGALLWSASRRQRVGQSA
ncbi:MAG TPA: hypothetical protein VFK68_11130 [Propionibacteriaceae bacterium]|nr:hypothetical protein [Propionibacteriaceae bacterium]